MNFLSKSTLNGLAKQAKNSPRSRKNFNLHTSHEDYCQRLLNAIHIDSYIQPHRHMETGKLELLVAVQGSFSIITFDDAGNFINTTNFGTEKHLDNFCQNIGVEIDPEVWHTVIAREENSILLEVKEGPFDSFKAKELAPWAPHENSIEAKKYFKKCIKFSKEKHTSS